jgi:tetraacyldisaccharide 4'-kinase
MAHRSFVANHLCRRSPVSYLLYPLSLIFTLILIFRRYLYKTILTAYRAPVFVISIGNITAGGTGKTPFTIFLAEQLYQNGLKVAVSHRGYKSELENEATIISDRNGLLPVAEKAGDEAWLIAKSLSGVPVVTGKDRTGAIKLLCNQYNDLNCIILDDSFQHLKVQHDLDIVIISNETAFGNGFVLPAGYLRESPLVLGKADLVILNCLTETDPVHQSIVAVTDKSKKPFIRGNFRIGRVYDFYGKPVSGDNLTGAKVMLLAGIGNPDSFSAMALQLKPDIAERFYLPDHCDYSDSLLRRTISSRFQKSGAEWILTTEKDYTKLRKYGEFAATLLVLEIYFDLGDSRVEILSLINRRITGKGKVS